MKTFFIVPPCGMLLASVLLNILQCTGQPSQQRIIKMSVVSRLKKSELKMFIFPQLIGPNTYGKVSPAKTIQTSTPPYVALVVKDLPAYAGDSRAQGFIPGSRRSPGEGNGNPLQYSCLGNPTERGDWWATVHGVAESQTQLSNGRTHCSEGVVNQGETEPTPPSPRQNGGRMRKKGN